MSDDSQWMKASELENDRQRRGAPVGSVPFWRRMDRRQLLAAILAVSLLSSCGPPKPDLAEARALFEARVLSATPSMGQVLTSNKYELVSFEKLDARDAELMGVKAYQMSCRVTLRHLTSHRARKNSQLGSMSRDQSFKKGDTCTVPVTLTFSKSENGWGCEQCVHGDITEIPNGTPQSMPDLSGSWHGAMVNPEAGVFNDREPRDSFIRIKQTGSTLDILRVWSIKSGDSENLYEQRLSGAVDTDGEFRVDRTVAFLTDDGNGLSDNPDGVGRAVRLARSMVPSELEKRFDEAAKRYADEPLDGEWFIFSNREEQGVGGKRVDAVVLEATPDGLRGDWFTLVRNVDRLKLVVKDQRYTEDATVSQDPSGNPWILTKWGNASELTLWRVKGAKRGAVADVAAFDKAIEMMDREKWPLAIQGFEALQGAHANDRFGFFAAYRLAQARCGGGDLSGAVSSLETAFRANWDGLTECERQWFLRLATPGLERGFRGDVPTIRDDRLKAIVGDASMRLRLDGIISPIVRSRAAKELDDEWSSIQSKSNGPRTPNGDALRVIYVRKLWSLNCLPERALAICAEVASGCTDYNFLSDYAKRLFDAGRVTEAVAQQEEVLFQAKRQGLRDLSGVRKVLEQYKAALGASAPK